MTPTAKQKCIAEQAVYGDLRAIVNNHFNADLVFRIDSKGVTLKYCNGEYPVAGIDKVKPILRPLSDLTKEITHKGYNDDKPFTPLVELLKSYTLGIDYAPCVILDYEIKHDTIYYTGKSGKRTFKSDYTFAKSLVWSINELDLANRLHFDTRNLIESSEAIDVNTLDINPYEV